MAVATDQNRTVYRAQDAVLTFVLPGEDGEGYTYEYTIRQRGASSATKTIDDEDITAVYSAPDTTITVPLTYEQTDIPTMAYMHSLWRLEAGNRYPLAVGTLTVEGSSHKT